MNQYTILIEDEFGEWNPIQRIFETLKSAEVVRQAYMDSGKTCLIVYRRITDWEIW